GGGGLGAVRIVPNAVKGRAAHPPKVEKNFKKKINKKEYIKALKSAISNVNLIVISDDYENIKKTKDVKKFLNLLKDKKILNSDKILIIVNENKKSSENLDKINVKKASEVTVYDFAPGATKLIQNVIITKKALESLENKIKNLT
ncbi:MAG: 50S ribosomal protein L4, partial [Candidatus Altarchaeaceae archaeon]